MSASPRDLLTPYALGLLGSQESAAVERALASDPALAAEHAEIVRHLALYERFPVSSAPPSFSAIAGRLTSAPRHAWLRMTPSRWVAAAAVVLVGAGLLFFEASTGPVYLGPPEPIGVAGQGLRVNGREGGPIDGDDVLTAERPADVRLNGTIHAVLAGDTTLALGPAGLLFDRVRLERGRAYFEVGPGPFQVRTEHGDVEVLGTRFEVDVRDGLVVTVAEGRVRVGTLEVGPGQRLAGGVVFPTTEEAGAFFRRPVLRLEGPGSARPGEVIQLRLVLENPTHVEQVVRGPETVATGALLTLTDPTGRVETQGLDYARALSGGLTALSPVTLGPLERRLTVFEVTVPSAPTGSWRLSALYRPQGEAPIASDPLTLEVR